LGEFFKIKNLNDRHVIVSPDGSIFPSLGVNHISAYSEEDPFNIFYSKYNGDWKRLARDAAQNLISWGFNTAGYHCPSEIRQYMPFMADPYPYPAQIAYWQPDAMYPDVFDPKWHFNVNQIISRMCESVKNAENLIGYYWTDTPRWDIEGARRQGRKDWVTSIRSLPKTAPGKQRYISFLKELYQSKHLQFESVYGYKLTDTEQLLNYDFSNINLEYPTTKQDDRKFLRIIAREYYKVLGNANRKADPFHLIFGDRYIEGDHPQEVIEEALPWIDVLSIQPLGVAFEEDFFDKLYFISKKPILICDHQSSFYTEKYPETLWKQLPDEIEAARAYHQYLTRGFEKPYIIGYHRCQYIDRYDRNGKFLKQGLIRENEEPYEKIVDQIKRTNHFIKALIKMKMLKSNKQTS
jgi:hypothetical protein